MRRGLRVKVYDTHFHDLTQILLNKENVKLVQICKLQNKCDMSKTEICILKG